MSFCARILAAMATASLVRVPVIKCSSVFQSSPDVFQDASSPFQDTFNPVQEPLDDPDTYLSSFTNIFKLDSGDDSFKLELPEDSSRPVKEKSSVKKDLHRDMMNPSTFSSQSSSFSPPPPPQFNIDTFTFNEENVRKTDDIFSLLADVDGSRQTTKVNKYSQKESKTGVPSSYKPSSTSIKVPGVGAANSFGKNILLAAKNLEELLKVVQKMKKKVDKKMGNSTASEPLSFPSLPWPSSFNESSAMIGLLLDPERLQGIQRAALDSSTEDEFLDHLTEVLTGTETRSGSALTLDPVTIIALLTLGNVDRKKGVCIDDHCSNTMVYSWDETQAKLL